MPIKHKIYYALAALHLLMIALFAGHLAETSFVKTLPGKALATAGNYTGSNNIFSFFAPGLSNQPYVIYTVQDSTGKETLVDFTGYSPEFSNRINNIYGYLTIPESRVILSASLAQSLLAKYPQSKRMRVTMLIQDIPTLQQYRSGKRSKWQFWFNHDFQRQ